jgi:hypothetical protein
VAKIPDAILVQCLEQLDEGQPLERVLEDCSEAVTALRQLLEYTRKLEGLAVDPPPAVQQRARGPFSWPRPPRLALGPRWLAPALAVMLLLLIAGTTAVRASEASVPGDMLYGTKLAVEKRRLLVASPEREAELTAAFRQERRNEVTQLLAAGRSAEVSFEGTLQSMVEGQWTVGGLPVAVDPLTVIVGSTRVGSEVRVSGWTHLGRVYADEIDAVGSLGGGSGSRQSRYILAVSPIPGR